MKNLLKNKYFKIGLTAFLVIAASILLFFIILNTKPIFSVIGKLFKILKPLIVGLIIAYIVNPIVKIFEKKVFNKVKKDTTRRNLSILCSFVVLIGLIVTIISIIIPQLLLSIESLVVNVPFYIKEAQKVLVSWLSDNSDLKVVVLDNYKTITDYLFKALNDIVLPATDSALERLSSGVFGFFGFIFNTFIGFVFAAYILANTKNFAVGIRKILYSLFKENTVSNIVNGTKHIDKVFGHFMIGKICDSSIVALLTFLFLIIFKFPYPLLIAVIIGMTDLIPYFGPYIGSIPSALLILLVSPIKAISFILFMLLLQQIDANLITPRIHKQSVGLPSFWVLFAITLFGGLFGIVGLLIGVPVFSIIYELINNITNNRLKGKKLSTEDKYYLDIIEEETKIS